LLYTLSLLEVKSLTHFCKSPFHHFQIGHLLSPVIVEKLNQGLIKFIQKVEPQATHGKEGTLHTVLEFKGTVVNSFLSRFLNG